MKKNRKYKQGIFNCKNKEKYKGTFPILYRSQWEFLFMRWCDANPYIVSWGSETVIIPYHNPLTGRISRYFVDFNISVKDKSGTIKKFLIEIKPSVQTVPPKQTRNTKSLLKRQAEYVKNQAKWQAALEYSTKKGYTFQIITEKHLGLTK